MLVMMTMGLCRRSDDYSWKFLFESNFAFDEIQYIKDVFWNQNSCISITQHRIQGNLNHLELQ